jgi:hypothetical protein
LENSEKKLNETIAKIEKSNYPKILILHRGIDINVDQERNKMFSEKFQLSILDYQDILRDKKLVYDIIVKKITINQNWNGILGIE